MSDKKIKGLDRFDLLGSVLQSMSSMAMGGLGNPQRTEGNVFNVEENGYVVDTCVASDTMTWETGIKPEGEVWVIVEQYHNKQDAEIGHAKWVEFMRENHERELDDIDIFGLDLEL